MSVIIGKVVKKKSGIGANSEWTLFAADPEIIKLESVEEPTIKWIGTYVQFNEMFTPSI